MQINHLMTKDGARITAVHAVAHATHDGVADWYFLGDLEWPEHNGKQSGAINREIPLWRICYDHDSDTAKEEFGRVHDAMNAHLLKHGKWLRDGKHMKDGRIAFWIAKQKEARTTI